MRPAKTAVALTLSATLALGMGACSGTTATDEGADQTAETTTETTEEATTTDSTDVAISAAISVDNTIAEDTDALVSTIPDRFTQETYTDEQTGKSITYNLFLPSSYDESAAYPMVVFIADSSCVGTDATRSLTQGRGGLVWATDEWQAVHPSIVVVPTYPETILDDHDGYTTTDYVELTKRFIDYMSATYAVDTSRIFGTGQSMGCMTTLILASEYPGLYAGCMFVDGQWDTTTLSGLEDQTFVYFAAEDDTSAWTGAQELMQLFDTDGVTYSYMQWQGGWTPDELSENTATLLSSGSNHYFVSWASGTIETSGTGSQMGGGNMMGGGGQMGEHEDDGEDGQMGEHDGGGEGDHMGTDGTTDGGAGGGMMGGAAYHMASFNYAYRCIAVMEWLFQQVA